MASDIGSIQPNPYIFNIENRRKRKARLAHEIGAGARCLKCAEKCPGFQLHFWRKICQNCRCGKDDHEVEDDDEDIGKIVIGKLFERPIRTKEEEQLYSYGTDLEMVNASTGQKEKVRFDWIPPGVGTAIAKRYMEMLPPDKRPVAGSEAAKERRRQLEHQVPLYDMDETERCELLKPEELKDFLKYLDILKTKVAGQGSVREISPLAHKQSSAANMSPRLNNRVTQTDQYDPRTTYLDNLPPPPDSWINSDPAGADMSSNSISTQSMENSLNNNIEGLSQKSAFISNLLQERGHSTVVPETGQEDAFHSLTLGTKMSLPPSEKPPLPPPEDTSPSFYQPILRSRYTPVQSELAVSEPINRGFSAQKGVPAGEGGYLSQCNQVIDPNQGNANLHPSHANLDAMQGTLNYPYQGNLSSPSKSSLLQLNSPKPFIAKSEQRNIPSGQFSSSLLEGSWQPSAGRYNMIGGQRGAQLAHDHASVGKENVNYVKDSNKVPTLERMAPLDGRVVTSNAIQAPYLAHKEKLIGLGCHSAQGTDVNVLFPQESETLRKRESSVSPASSGVDEALRSAQFLCQYCKLSMKPGDVAVICERAGPGKYWHPKCFVCVTCKELLADLIYFYKDGQVFCGRHYTQAADIPRCKACDELIFGDTWTRADGCDWHVHHFCCFVCDKPLAGSKYIPDERDYPHCLSCYVSFKAKMCESCDNKIGPEEKRTGYNGYFFHALPECFCCYACKMSLMGKRFKMVKNWVFCSQECVVDSGRDLALNPNPKKKET